MDAPKPPTAKPTGKLTKEDKAFREHTHASRVEYVAEMMRTLEYRSLHVDRLAEEWKLGKSAVRAIVKEATAIVRAELADDHDHVLSRVGAALNRALDEAFLRGDVHALIKAAQVYAVVSGASAPQRVKVEGDLSALTPEQLASRKAEILERLRGQPEGSV